jgi:hypothetical protein
MGKCPAGATHAFSQLVVSFAVRKAASPLKIVFVHPFVTVVVTA